MCPLRGLSCGLTPVRQSWDELSVYSHPLAGWSGEDSLSSDLAKFPYWWDTGANSTLGRSEGIWTRDRWKDKDEKEINWSTKWKSNFISSAQKASYSVQFVTPLEMLQTYVSQPYETTHICFFLIKRITLFVLLFQYRFKNVSHDCFMASHSLTLALSWCRHTESVADVKSMARSQLLRRAGNPAAQ